MVARSTKSCTWQSANATASSTDLSLLNPTGMKNQSRSAQRCYGSRSICQSCEIRSITSHLVRLQWSTSISTRCPRLKTKVSRLLIGLRHWSFKPMCDWSVWPMMRGRSKTGLRCWNWKRKRFRRRLMKRKKRPRRFFKLSCRTKRHSSKSYAIAKKTPNDSKNYKNQTNRWENKHSYANKKWRIQS